MNIVFFNLAGPFFPGGCEKYFSNLARIYSKKNNVYFIHSKEYVSVMERVYSVISDHKVGSINYIKRDMGSSKLISISILSLLPLAKEHNEIKNILLSADSIYSKNEFQELLILYLLLGKKDYSSRVIVGIRSAIFIPPQIKGIWAKIHNIQYFSFLYKKFLKNAKKIHVPNKDYVTMIVNKYKVDKEKIEFVPNFIAWGTKITSRKNFKKFKILWAGRASPQKGIDRLIKIIELTSKSNNFDNMEFVMVGQGEDKKIKEITKKYKNVNFLGVTKDMESLYRNVDISIITSYWETFSNIMLESQSFGVPVISYDIPGCRDIVIQNKTGYLVNNEEEFAEKINDLYKMKEQKFISFNKMKQHAYKNSNKMFFKKYILNQIEEKVFSYLK